MIDLVSALLLVAGLFFYLAGSVAMLRLPDPYSRLHALTKADNLGLGLLVLGLSLQVSDVLIVLKLLLIWWLVLVASAAGSQLIAQYNRRAEREQEQRP